MILDENVPIGTELNTTISISRPNIYRNIRYWLAPNDTFAIDRNGRIRTIVNIDRERMQQSDGIYELKVRIRIIRL